MTFTLTELINVILPLLLYHNISLLTLKRRDQHNKLLYVIENSVTKFDLIPETVHHSKHLLDLSDTSPDFFLSLPFLTIG